MDAPGRLAEAIAQLEESLRLEPDSAQTHFNLAVALLRSGERTDEAVTHLRASLRLQPANEQARALLGKLGGG
jgi:Flp pilus assembly protein TadD